MRARAHRQHPEHGREKILSLAFALSREQLRHHRTQVHGERHQRVRMQLQLAGRCRQGLPRRLQHLLYTLRAVRHQHEAVSDGIGRAQSLVPGLHLPDIDRGAPRVLYGGVRLADDRTHQLQQLALGLLPVAAFHREQDAGHGRGASVASRVQEVARVHRHDGRLSGPSQQSAVRVHVQPQSRHQTRQAGVEGGLPSGHLPAVFSLLLLLQIGAAGGAAAGVHAHDHRPVRRHELQETFDPAPGPRGQDGGRRERCTERHETDDP